VSRTEPDTAGAKFAATVRAAVKSLEPGYFALIMATGILSTAMRNRHAYALSVALLWIGLVCFTVLIILTVWRIASFSGDVRTDITDPRRGFGFLTFIAATEVLGVRINFDGYHEITAGLLAVGVLAWLILGYGIPFSMLVGRLRPITQYANGSWFIWIVASQSIAVLAASIEPTATTLRRELAFLAVFSWSVGIFLYAAVGLLVAFRLLHDELRAADLTPPYWVAMGATAITVLAGARILNMSDSPVLAATRAVVAGGSVAFWSFGTWLIPALLAAGWWRHVVRRFPLRYTPTAWSMVFPIVMYGVGSDVLGQADHLPGLSYIGEYENWVGLGVWLVTFVAMLQHLVQSVRSGQRP